MRLSASLKIPHYWFRQKQQISLYREIFANVVTHRPESTSKLAMATCLRRSVMMVFSAQLAEGKGAPCTLPSTLSPAKPDELAILSHISPLLFSLGPGSPSKSPPSRDPSSSAVENVLISGSAYLFVKFKWSWQILCHDEWSSSLTKTYNV